MSTPATKKANIAVIGAGWWTQGWHLPHLYRNSGATIAAIVDQSPHPRSNLNPNLESLADLGDKYKAPIFSSVQELLAASSVDLDGVLIATPHATHYSVGQVLLEEAMRRKQSGEKPLHILMEKPMTTDVHEAKKLLDLVKEYKEVGGEGVFLINHSANYRSQPRKARDVIISEIGDIRHVSACFASPLIWIFDDPANKGWNEPTGDMQGNGYAWGQSSHLLGWIFHVCPQLVPEKVFCVMNHAEATGADVAHAATIICRANSGGGSVDGSSKKVGDVVMSISGTTLLPGNEHSDSPIGKKVDIKIYGSKGAVMYCGDDRDQDSGSLELRREDGKVELPCGAGFDFENTDVHGTGPESLQSFIAACQGKTDYYAGADALLGLRTIQTLEAFYRSNASRRLEDVHYSEL
jgi:predicted dehydrogenase